MTAKNMLPRIVLACLLALACAAPARAATGDAFEYRIADAVAPFFEEGRDVEHWSGLPYAQYDTAEAPYADTAALDRATLRFADYVGILARAGYTALVLDDLNHFTTYESENWYPRDSAVYLRGRLYREYARRWIAIARNAGLGVYVSTDLPFFTPELEAAIGPAEADNPRLTEAYRVALEECFAELDPDGIVMRAGEGGAAYDSGSYRSAVAYRTPESLNAVLRAILPVFERADKTLVVRTWTIGFGSVGDLLTNAATYDRVFAGLEESRHLVASVKYSPGDFFLFDQPNPTVGHGRLPQIVELQVRREYEWGGDFPRFVTADYAPVVRSLAAMPAVRGVWTWNQQGGWGFGRRALFNFGFNLWNELDFHAVAGLLRDPEADPAVLLNAALAKYGFSPGERAVLRDIMLDAPRTVREGWYVDEFRRKQYWLGPVRVPPLSLLWWDRLTTSPFSLALVAAGVRDPAASVRQAADACGRIEKHLAAWTAATDSSDATDKLVTLSLRHQLAEFRVLAEFRASFFSYFRDPQPVGTAALERRAVEYRAIGKGLEEDFSFDLRELPAHIGRIDRLPLRRPIVAALLAMSVLCLALLPWGRKVARHAAVRTLCAAAACAALFVVAPAYLLADSDFLMLFSRSHAFVFAVSLLSLSAIRAAERLARPRSTDAWHGALADTATLCAGALAAFQLVLGLDLAFWESTFWLWATKTAVSDRAVAAGWALVAAYALVFYACAAVRTRRWRPSQAAFARVVAFAAVAPALAWLALGSATGQATLLETIEPIAPSYFSTAGSGMEHLLPRTPWEWLSERLR